MILKIGLDNNKVPNNYVIQNDRSSDRLISTMGFPILGP